MSSLQEFKRLNFFTGFFTTAKDWNDGANYHLDKRKLHNRGLHRPGVIEGLEVEPHPDGGLKLLVRPGAALDGDGNLLYLAQEAPVDVKADDLSVGVFITIKFRQFASDKVTNLQDSDFSGETRITERPKVAAGKEAPDDLRLELARIHLTAGSAAGSTSAGPPSLAASDIDVSNRPIAGVHDTRFDVLKLYIANLHRYLLDKQRRHNRGLHTPGVIPKVAGELKVEPHQGLTVKIQPGAALDEAGNELFLDDEVLRTIAKPATETDVYVVAQFVDTFTQYLDDPGKTFAGLFRTAEILLVDAVPDNKTLIELARIHLTPDVAEIGEPNGVQPPGNNQINREHRKSSGSIGLTPKRLPKEVQDDVNQKMKDTREHFADLAQRFPAPSVDDTRNAAIQLQMAIGSLEPDQFPDALDVLAQIEADVESELAEQYPPLVDRDEFTAYQDAVAVLKKALREGQPPATLITRQAAVSGAALDLSQVVFVLPTAHAGENFTVETPGDEAMVSLDASQSKAPPGRTIKRYFWEKKP